MLSVFTISCSRICLDGISTYTLMHLTHNKQIHKENVGGRKRDYKNDPIKNRVL